MAFAFDFTGRTVIVTGASRGIGREIAMEMARQGANVVAAARSAEPLAALVAEIEALGGGRQALAVVADLSDPQAPARVVQAAGDRFGRIDFLVNNAGGTKRGPFLEMADEDIRAGFDLKYHATRRFCKEAWPDLVRAEGVIVNIAGCAAFTPSADFTAGGPVNSALINLSKAIAEQGIRDGVRINVICPGDVETDRLAGRIDRFAQDRGLSREEAARIMLKEKGIRRFGRPQDIAHMAVFLCTPQASYVHGAVITVDGGATRGI